eukprot:gnl/TRDRNA2_/TRDRNA2_94353_c0_seq1.p1 gnl/TRDRNA2_/TRDRNA2_94353_c0~~gnl/TRDRNA2_/TRDRNA2_94353_c0_seq1.p1  ORF type:complete len:230 (-),score=42.41 gnl/TRDRNA2_/TRDRNA2_94353_c0_seq1:111-800(-)
MKHGGMPVRTMLVTFACALICANAQKHFRIAIFGQKDCAGTAMEDMVFSMDLVAKMYFQVDLDKCVAYTEQEGAYMMVDSAACKVTMHTNSDCSDTALHTHDMSYAAAECENKDGDDPKDMSEKSGCVDTIPPGAKDLTCWTVAEMNAMNAGNECGDDCGKGPTTKAEFDEMSAGCAKDCPAVLLSAYEKYVVGCPAVAPAPPGTTGSAHFQYAHFFVVPAILLGFFSH